LIKVCDDSSLPLCPVAVHPHTSLHSVLVMICQAMASALVWCLAARVPGIASMKVDRYTSTDAPPSFKAMTWNVLADGLHDDGFVAQPDGDFFSYKPKLWDDCVSLPPNETTSCMEEGHEGALAKVADFISDQEKFAKLVIIPLKKKIEQAFAEANVPKGCRDEKGVLRVYGVAMSQCIRADFEDNVINNVFSLAPSKKAVEKLKTVAGAEKCRDEVREGEDPWPAIERVSTDDTIMQFLMASAHKLAMKWDLNGAREKTNALLAWESTAREEQQEGFLPPSGKRGELIRKRILKEKPDILALQELDHYRFFQDQLSEHNYATTLPGKEVKYTLAIGCAEKNWKKTTDAEKESCRNERRFARASKFGSMTQTFNAEQKPCPGQTQCHDNDGVALFWNTRRFEAKEIQLLRYSEQLTQKSDDGVVGVLLTDLLEHAACI